MRLLKNSKLNYWCKVLLCYLPFFILLLFLRPEKGFLWDMYCWKDWTKYIYTEGLPNVYKSWTDYLPLYQYVLFFFGKIQGSTEAIATNIYKLKDLSIFFELCTTLVLFRLLENKFKDTYKAILFSLFYFLNIAVLFNSMLWGQVDGIMSFFIFVAVILGYKKKLFPCLLFFLLALNMKLQAIVFAPVVGLLVLPLMVNKARATSTIFSFIGLIVIQLLIFLPFIYVGDFPKLWAVVTGSVGKFPMVSMNAYNMWYFFFRNPQEIPDSVEFLKISYKTWGLFLFFVTSFFALLHFVKPFFLTVFRKARAEYSAEKLIISCALIPLLFFFFNTQMHERYSHPALIFLAVYAMMYNRPLVFALGSVAYFLNMEGASYFFRHTNMFIFKPWVVACIYLSVIVLLFIDLYRDKGIHGSKQ